MAKDQLADTTTKLVRAMRTRGKTELEFATTLEEAHREMSPRKYNRVGLLSHRIEGLNDVVSRAIADWIEASGKKAWY